MKAAKIFYLAIIIICLIVLAGSAYYVLGGFDEVEVYEFEGSERTVIGKHYIDKFEGDKLLTIMQETKSMIDNGRLRGQLALVDFQNDTIGSDSSHYFIGASFDEIRNVLELPAGFTYEEFKTRKIYRVFITQHPLVRPLPSDIRSMLEVRAIEDGEVLTPYTFDIYYSDGSWCTEAWVK